jgi:FtsH-binding integral membrane protein
VFIGVRRQSITTSQYMEETNKTVYWLRWVGVLPAAVAAYIVIQVMVAIGNIITGLPDFYVQLFNSIVASFCFVYAGAKTAPRYSFIVALTLTIIFTILNGSVLTLVFVTHRYYSGSLTWLVICCILGIVSTIAACAYFHEEDNENTTDA